VLIGEGVHKLVSDRHFLKWSDPVDGHRHDKFPLVRVVEPQNLLRGEIDDELIEIRRPIEHSEEFEDRLIACDLLLVEVFLKRLADSFYEVGLVKDRDGRNLEEWQTSALLHIEHDHAYARAHRGSDLGGDRLGRFPGDRLGRNRSERRLGRGGYSDGCCRSVPCHCRRR